MRMRLDRLTAVLIDAVLKNSSCRSMNTMARVLAKNGVPFHVALRVLTRPAERRQS
jgi:hypothetical protein